MADLFCNICCEPWDSYGVSHGDMQKWEADLFKKGAGCPSCEGVRPHVIEAIDSAEKHLRSIIFGGTDDPHSFALVNNPDAPLPKWERPADKVVRKCESCGDKAVIKQDAEDDELYWDGISYNCLFNPGIEWTDAINAPDAFTLNGKFYCPSCVANCADCGELTFQDELYLPDGKYRKDDAVCEDCLSKYFGSGD